MTTYEDIATAQQLDSDTARRYVHYMRHRWLGTESQKCEDGYASEWAMRFRLHIEYEASDLEGQALLRDLQGEQP